MAASPHSSMPIDGHAHVFRRDLPMVAGRRYAPDYDATIEDYIARLDRFGFSHGVLVQPSFLGTDNSFILTALRLYPDRLRAIAVVDPEVGDGELDELQEAGVVGLRLNLIGRPTDICFEPRWQALFERVAKRDWQIEIQRSMDDLATVLPVLLESGARVMVDHFGLPGGPIDPDKPAHRDFLALLGHERLWVKLSAPYRARLDLDDARAAFDHLRIAAGSDERIVWGSDWPHTQHEAANDYPGQLAWLNAVIPDEGLRQRIVSINPSNLFGLAAS
jgi:predicted TIM-barrel fold metal-dependent hydrolase